MGGLQRPADRFKFVGLAVLFIVLGTPPSVARSREVRAIERDAGADAPPSTRASAVNGGLVMFVSQALQVLSVSVAIGAFFAAVGVLVIDLDQTVAWIGGPADVLVEFTLFDHEAVVTAERLGVAAIAAFTGLYYISMLTDDVRTDASSWRSSPWRCGRAWTAPTT